MRVQTARFNDYAVPDNEDVLASVERQVEAITGSRFYGDHHQYEVKWQGAVDTQWVNADKLTCIDLIKNYEININ